ncbi:MAG: Peptidoglycan binding protein [Candidatus Tokpelaia sp. JSC085]|nr:MAG: Peptidoglycan binding protein [Candidatus Tokpelaia sp. JSC085]
MKRFLVLNQLGFLLSLFLLITHSDSTIAYVGNMPVVPPQFDSLMTNTDGIVEIRGKAVGFTHVELINGADIIGDVDVTEKGLFLIQPTGRLMPGEYHFVLRAIDEKSGCSATSLQTLLVSTPEQGNGKVLALVEEPGKAHRLISSQKTFHQVSTFPEREFAVESIIFQKGKLTVCGKKPANMQISIISDTRTIGSGHASDGNAFCVIRVRAMEVGDYIFRVELTDVSGKRADMISLPFSIRNSAGVTRQLYRAGYPVNTIIVRRGETLSHIAKRVYGSSTFTRVLFEANRDQIRRPCEIYAGQEFVLPLIKKQ